MNSKIIAAAFVAVCEGGFSCAHLAGPCLYYQQPGDFNACVQQSSKTIRYTKNKDAAQFRLYPEFDRHSYISSFQKGGDYWQKHQDLINQSSLTAMIQFAKTHQDQFLIFHLNDLHGAWGRYAAILDAVQKIITVHPQLQICFSGDINAKFDGCDASFSGKRTHQFMTNLVKTIKRIRQDNDVYWILGNHDTKNYGGTFSVFVNNAQAAGIKLLTNTPEAFTRKGFKNPNALTTVSSVKGRVAFIPFTTNMALNGLDPDALTYQYQRNFAQFFTDGYRQGRADHLFLAPSGYMKDWRDVIGDPKKGLNPITKNTADAFFGTLRKLEEQYPGDDPLEIVIMAHDHFLRVLFLYQQVSKYFPQYRLSSNLLKRLHITILGGHESAAYLLEPTFQLYCDDNKMQQIPCRAVCNGFYGEAGALVALPNIPANQDLGVCRNFTMQDLPNTDQFDSYGYLTFLTQFISNGYSKGQNIYKNLVEKIKQYGFEIRFEYYLLKTEIQWKYYLLKSEIRYQIKKLYRNFMSFFS